MIVGVSPDAMITIRTPALAWIVLVLMADLEDLIVTSIGDGQHAAASAHYRGEAVDIRSHDLPTLEHKRARQVRLAGALGPRFVVLLEPYDVPGSTAAEHLHCQLRAGETLNTSQLATALDQTWMTRWVADGRGGPRRA